MRIEIHSGGASSVLALDNGLSSLHTNISSTIESLQNIAHRLDNVTGGAGNLTPAIESVQKRINSEQTKLAKVERFRSKVTQFISNTVNTDAQVAHTVIVNQEKFFNKYSWLRPPVPVEEPQKSGWDRFCEGWNKFWGGAGEKISKAWNGIKSFVKEHAVELIVGTVAIVVGAAIVALTGGTAAAFIPALLAGLKVAAISAATSGAISAVIAGFKGENVLKAFGDGLASGYMWGGIFFAAGSAINAAKTAFTGTKEVAKAGVSSTNGRPSWRESELHANSQYPKYKTQQSYLNGQKVPYGTKGSVRPDNMKAGWFSKRSLEVKNYNLSSSGNRNNLAKKVVEQFNKRSIHLPKGTKQEVLIDLRGQSVSANELSSMINKIKTGTNNLMKIRFIK